MSESNRAAAAREQLDRRSYRKNATLVEDKNGTTVEQWVHPVGPDVLFCVYTVGWDLFVQADTTNTISATWDSLDVQLKTAEDRRTEESR